MRRRAPLVLILLAGAVVCLLLWDTVVAPALLDSSSEESASLLGEDGTLTTDAVGEDAEVVTGLRGRPGAASANGSSGPDGGGDAAIVADAQRAGAASVPFEGRVVGPRGAPVEGVKIVVRGAGGTQTIETGAGGRFKSTLPPGRYALMFQSDEGGLIVRSWMLDGAPKDDLEFALREPAAIRVQVNRGEERVAGAEVTVMSRDMGDLASYMGASDVGGTALFEGLIPGRYEVTTQVPDGPLARGNTYAAAGSTRELKLRVPDGIVLRGTVRAGKDGPGVAAAITLESAVRGSYGLFVTNFETNADGTYEVTVPKGAARQFLVEAEGYAPWPELKQRRNVLRSLRNLARKGPVVRDVVLKGGAALSGRVQTEDEAPLPGIALRFRMRRGPTVSVTSGADGTYQVANLNPGRYELQIESPAYFPIATQALNVNIPGGADPAPVTLDVTLAGARRLAGTVVDAAGQGVGGARVWITGGGRVLRSARDAGRELEVFSRADGGWAIVDIPPDKTVVVHAAMGDLQADPVVARWEKPPPQPIRMSLKGTAVLRGTVVDLATRQPLRRARVRVVPDPWDGRSSRTVQSNNQGEIVLERMLPGRWKLTPSLTGYLPAQPEGVDLVRDKETEVTLRLDPGQVFAGQVVTEAGAPLRYARVRVWGRPDGAERDVARAANTDARGQFRLTGFRQGVYSIRASRSGFRSERMNDMRRGDENIRFVLRRR